MDPGAIPEAALVRELRQRLGVLAEIPATGPRFVLRDTKAGLELSGWFIGDWHGNVVNAAPDEHDDVAWFGTADLEALDLAHPRYLDSIRGAVADAT